MIVFNNFNVFKDVTAAQESEITINTQGEVATVQVSGGATGISLSLLGQSDFRSTDWFPVSAIKLEGLDLVDTITSDGIYQFPIDGIGRFKFNLSAIGGGSVSVFCKVTKEV